MTPAPDRLILLADADAFYVSVARLIDPEGAGRAKVLIVGGSAEGRGVVLSASYEARAYGIESAMPTAQALRLCPHATVAPVPWNVCREKGRQIRSVLERFTPAVQAASIDECYLDMTGTERLYEGESPADTARRMRAAVLAETGLTVSIGGGSSRLIAKLAAGVAKPSPHHPGDGVHIVPRGEEEAFMRRFTLADIPGIGPKTAKRLDHLGLRTVEDVMPLDRSSLAARLGVGHKRAADWLYRRVRGMDASRVDAGAGAKSMSRDETFGRDLDGDDDLLRVLAQLVDRATGDLRESGLLTRTVCVKLRDWDFRTRQARRTLPAPVLSDRVVYDVARTLFERLRAARRVPARLLGVSLSGLVHEHPAPQLDLWADELTEELETKRDRTIARAMDEVRGRFGRKAVRRGSGAGGERGGR